VQKQWRQQCRCGLVQPEYGPIEGVEFTSEAVDKQDERSQTDKIKMYGQGRSKPANQNKDSGQQVEEPDHFKEEALPFHPRRSSGDIHCLLEDIVGPADCISGLRLADFIEDLSDFTIALDFAAIYCQQDIPWLNTGVLRGPIPCYLLSLN
jgi:hypothetical protein